MKASFPAVALALAIGFAAPAQADTVSYRFSGSFYYVTQIPSAPVPASPVELYGFVFQPGQAFNGTLSYSTDLIPYDELPGYRAYVGDLAISVAVPSTGFAIPAPAGPTSGRVNVFNDGGHLGDSAAFESTSELNGDAHAMAVEFFDSSESAFSDLSLPVQLSLASFDEVNFLLQGALGTPYAINVIGRITSFEQIAAVPEPDTWLMLAAGLGLLGWTRYRGQQQARRG